MIAARRVLAATAMVAALSLFAGSALAQDADEPQIAQAEPVADVASEANFHGFTARAVLGVTTLPGIAVGYVAGAFGIDMGLGLWNWFDVPSTVVRLRAMVPTPRPHGPPRFWVGVSAGYRFVHFIDDDMMHGSEFTLVLEGRWWSNPILTTELAVGVVHYVQGLQQDESFTLPAATFSVGFQF